MKAWIINSFDGISRAERVDVADPVPGGGEVLMRVRFAALNPADAYLAAGQYPAKPPLPHIVGRDGVGEIIAVGPDVRSVKIGATKAILRGPVGVDRWGTLAERVVVPVDSLIDVPDGWDIQQAAGAALVYLTGYQAITQWHDLPARTVVLISGASGGVGVASTHLAHAMGHTVVGLSRDPGKRKMLKSIGMDIALDPTDPAWRKSLAQQLGDRKVGLAIDNIGGAGFGDLIATLGLNGRVSCVGALAGPVPQFNTPSIFFRRIRIGGVAISTYSNLESHAAWKEIVKLVRETGARPIVDKVYPFDDVPAAFAHLARGPMGKVLIET